MHELWGVVQVTRSCFLAPHTPCRKSQQGSQPRETGPVKERETLPVQEGILAYTAAVQELLQVWIHSAARLARHCALLAGMSCGSSPLPSPRRRGLQVQVAELCSRLGASEHIQDVAKEIYVAYLASVRITEPAFAT